MQARALTQLPKSKLGEGPLWDDGTQQLYWVDIEGYKIHRFNPANGHHECMDTGTYVGFVAINTAGHLVVGLRDGIYQMAFGNPDKKLIAQPLPVNDANRFNDGKVAPDGSLFAGTMYLTPPRQTTGAFYHLKGGKLTTVAEPIHISNGLGWSPDRKVMYYIDTGDRAITQFDYDAATGIASNRRLFVTIPVEEGSPDGLCVDSVGRVLCAMWGGARVNIYAPDGKLDQIIAVDAPQPTCVAFGGPDLKTLYITSAYTELSSEQLAVSPLSGSLFTIDMPIAGQASTRFNG